jgi:cobalt-precorrin-5B (C1)-methyltransferase
MVEHLLPAFYPLHSGLTTGTCATAAAVAAALQFRALSSGAGNDVSTELPAEVPVVLPDGETIQVPVVYGDGFAAVIKASGDDPDVTDGLEIRVRLEPSDHVEICGGEGVGIITLPGFDFPPGSPAINRVPREMILRNLSLLSVPPFRVTISVPEGATVARRTFNPRLGIEGGISIIGVSGIVKPFSEEAFIDSIRRCMQIVKASGCGHVVINSGGKSERFVKACYPDLPRQAFVEYGNYIGETLRMAAEFGIPRVTLGVMLGKAVKLAEGHLDTHSRKATMNKAFIAEMLGEAGCEADIRGMTLARELWALLSPEQAKAFARVVIAHCAQHCRPLLPDGTLEILLIDDEGRIYSGEE